MSHSPRTRKAIWLAVATLALGLLGCGDDDSGPPADDPPVPRITGKARAGKGPQFGFTEVAANFPPQATPEQIARTQARIAPRSLARITVQWRTAQPDPDEPPDFGIYDPLVRALTKHGLRPVPVLMAAPEWAWEGDCNPVNRRARGYCIMPPADDAEALESWREFVEAAVQHFGGTLRAPLAGVEVWNEENGGGFWNDLDGPNAEHYRNVLCSAAEGVRSVSDGVPVIMGGLANHPTDEFHIGPTEFLAELYELSGRDVRECMDAIGVHPYPLQRPPGEPGSPYLEKLNAIREIRDANGDRDRPLWITEFGYFTRSPGPGEVTEAEQAQGLVCGYLLAAEMPDVDAFIVHTLIDRGPGGTPEESYGIDYNPRSPEGLSPKAADPALEALLARTGKDLPAAEGCGARDEG